MTVKLAERNSKTSKQASRVKQTGSKQTLTDSRKQAQEAATQGHRRGKNIDIFSIAAAGGGRGRGRLDLKTLAERPFPREVLRQAAAAFIPWPCGGGVTAGAQAEGEKKPGRKIIKRVRTRSTLYSLAFILLSFSSLYLRCSPSSIYFVRIEALKLNALLQIAKARTYRTSIRP